jgi:hypothetical protein
VQQPRPQPQPLACYVKVCGCWLVRFSGSPTSVDLDLHDPNLVLDEQICNETSATIWIGNWMCSCGYRKCVFVDFVTGYIGPFPIVFIVECRVVNNV